MNKKQNKQQDLSFEKALNRLDAIVSELESDDIQLKYSISLYEEGMKLFKFCQKELNQAEHKVYILKQNLQNDNANTQKNNESETPKLEKKISHNKNSPKNDLIQKNFQLFEDLS